MLVDLVVLASDSNSIKREYVTIVPIANDKIPPIKIFCIERRETERNPSSVILHSFAKSFSEKTNGADAVLFTVSSCYHLFIEKCLDCDGRFRTN